MSIHINTAKINESASSLERLNVKLTAAVSDSSVACGTLKSSWSGEAGEKASALFSEIKNGCLEYEKAAVNDFVSFMRSRVVQGYEAVENFNKDLGELFK